MMKLCAALASILVLCQLSEGRTFPRGRYDSMADGYSSMGDIEWRKRAGYDNWINPAYGYSSMADTDWGWKKRSDDDADVVDDDDADVDKRSNKIHNSYYTPYRYRQPYALAASSYLPYKSYSEPQASVSAPANDHGISQRSRGGDRQYGYVSMADLDWGWKKKRSDPTEPSKRNLASLARGNELPYRFRARRVHPSQESDEVDPFSFLAHQYDLINEQQAANEDEMQRQTRSGIGALARNGGIRPAAAQPGRR